MGSFHIFINVITLLQLAYYIDDVFKFDCDTTIKTNTNIMFLSNYPEVIEGIVSVILCGLHSNNY